MHRLKKWKNCSWNQESSCRVKSFVKNLQEILVHPQVVLVQNWFTTRQQESEVKVPSVTNTYKDESGLPQTCFLNYGDQSCQILKAEASCLWKSMYPVANSFFCFLGLVSKVGEKVSDLSELEFKAKSSTYRAWYDVDMFLSHRVTSSSETDLELRRMNGLT
ncbi:uncharacterized protein [Gossypium hirsutum]|uniref:Uncharacterized protein isoform X2 n=1 Tax=Gossypium hirsutum TaxID=3635 RepID=A0A1U8J1G2_GOSHI|nr:uncharacterized protein LOC107901078 isoform X2 [Gossypium hirsutum]